MVLHNDKWKYKAKRSYQIKHNLDKNNEPNVDTSAIEDGDIINSQDENGDEDEEDEETAIAREREIIGNSWRFLDPEMSTELLRDPEYVAKLEREKQLELEKNQFYNDIVNEKLKADNLDADALNEKYKVKRRVVGFKKMKDEDILKWKLENSDDDDDESDDDQNIEIPSEIREFSPEEQENFLKLQKIIDHKKRVEEMRKTISKHKPTVGKNIHEIQTSKESDNYAYLVNKQLQEAVITKNTANFEDLVDGLLGVDLNEATDEPVSAPSAPKFDLDNIITEKKSTKPKASKKNVKLDLQDDFLDSIL